MAAHVPPGSTLNALKFTSWYRAPEVWKAAGYLAGEPEEQDPCPHIPATYGLEVDLYALHRESAPSRSVAAGASPAQSSPARPQ